MASITREHIQELVDIYNDLTINELDREWKIEDWWKAMINGDLKDEYDDEIKERLENIEDSYCGIVKSGNRYYSELDGDVTDEIDSLLSEDSIMLALKSRHKEVQKYVNLGMKNAGKTEKMENIVGPVRNLDLVNLNNVIIRQTKLLRERISTPEDYERLKMYFFEICLYGKATVPDGEFIEVKLDNNVKKGNLKVLIHHLATNIDYNSNGKQLPKEDWLPNINLEVWAQLVHDVFKEYNDTDVASIKSNFNSVSS